MTRIRKTILILSVLLLVGSLAYAGIVYLYLRDGTEYAPGFAPEKFNQVQTGMTRAEVHSILGAPLSIEHVEPFEIWDYSDDVKEIQNGNEFYFPLGKANLIWFNQSGFVSNSKGERVRAIRSGMPKDEVKNILGNPQRKDISRNVILEYYTLPPNLGRYEERAVGFDKNGMVSELRIRSYHYD